ncbi:hypothetical protein GCM10020001_074840 [Nonomuraea salmonea]
MCILSWVAITAASATRPAAASSFQPGSASSGTIPNSAANAALRPGSGSATATTRPAPVACARRA